MDSPQTPTRRKDLGGGGMVMVGGALNLLFAIVYIFTYTPSAYSISPNSIVPIFILTGLIFIASGVLGYRGTKAKIMGVVAILFALVQIAWLYIFGIIFVGGLLGLGFIFAIIGGIKLFSSKAS